jgi:lia operon protein LiaI
MKIKLRVVIFTLLDRYHKDKKGGNDMSKWILGLLAVIAGIVLLANLGPMIALAVCVLILYFVLKEFLKAETTGKKILWGIVGVIVLVSTISNIPAIIGVIAAITLYYVYKKWNDAGDEVAEEDDPFHNFEKQWVELKK